MKRRNFLAGTFASVGVPALIGRAVAAEAGVPLPIPAVLDLDGGAGQNLDAIQSTHSFFDGSKTRTLGFSQSYMGPVLRMKRGQTAAPVVMNKTEFPITAHWHGLHVPGRVDGGPQLAFGPGETWAPELEIDQPAATHWYHSHVFGMTADQVYYGLAGMLIIDDPDAPPTGLPETYGVDDIPVVLQDRAFQGAQLLYIKRGPSLMHGFRADQMVVNGAIRPTHTAPKGLTRLRFLNGSNARIYTLRFEDDRTFYKVASDGGLLPTPVALKSITLAPAERMEIVVDFANGQSTRLVSAPDFNSPMGGMMRGMMGGSDPEAVTDAGEFEVMRFDVDSMRNAKVTALPDTFEAAPAPAFGEPVRRRSFSLNMMGGMMGGGMMGRGGMGGMTINGKPMDRSRIDEAVKIGDTEIWEIRADEMAHPFHVHGTSFQVLRNRGRDVPYETTGLKDVVLVDGTAEILVKFDRTADAATPYMYHCHILEHEDAGMMGQFTVG